MTSFDTRVACWSILNKMHPFWLGAIPRRIHLKALEENLIFDGLRLEAKHKQPNVLRMFMVLF